MLWKVFLSLKFASKYNAFKRLDRTISLLTNLYFMILNTNNFFFVVTRPVRVTYLRIDGPTCQLRRRSRHRIMCAQDHRAVTATQRWTTITAQWRKGAVYRTRFNDWKSNKMNSLSCSTNASTKHNTYTKSLLSFNRARLFSFPKRSSYCLSIYKKFYVYKCTSIAV